MTFSVGRFLSSVCKKIPFLHKFLAALEIQFHTGLSLSIKYADCQSFKASVFRHFESEVLLGDVNYVTSAICYRPSICRLYVCLSVVCNVGAPYSGGCNFRQFFPPYDSSGTLVFCCQKSLVGDAPFPLKFALKVTHPHSSTTISTKIGS